MRDGGWKYFFTPNCCCKIGGLFQKSMLRSFSRVHVRLPLKPSLGRCQRNCICTSLPSSVLHIKRGRPSAHWFVIFHPLVVQNGSVPGLSFFVISHFRPDTVRKLGVGEIWQCCDWTKLWSDRRSTDNTVRYEAQVAFVVSQQMANLILRTGNVTLSKAL